MRGETEKFVLPPEAGSWEQGAGSGEGSAREAPEKIGEPADFSEKVGLEVESAKRGIAEAVWGEPGRFAAASAKSNPELGRFIRKFAELGDDVLLTDALRKDRNTARAAIG